MTLCVAQRVDLYPSVTGGRDWFARRFPKGLDSPGGLGWDGEYIVLGEQANASVERFKNCKVVGTAQLGFGSEMVMFYITGHRLYATDGGNAAVGTYRYPKGGAPINKIGAGGGFSEPIGVVVVPVRGQ
jgi:hypothetical protein